LIIEPATSIKAVRSLKLPWHRPMSEWTDAQFLQVLVPEALESLSDDELDAIAGIGTRDEEIERA
jgi:hypothetical protein